MGGGKCNCNIAACYRLCVCHTHIVILIIPRLFGTGHEQRDRSDGNGKKPNHTAITAQDLKKCNDYIGMGLLHIYDTISSEHTQTNGNGRLKDILPNFDFSKAVIIKAGERVDENYTVTDDDVLYIRVTPTATVVAVVAVVVAVVAAGVAVGTAIYANSLAAEAEEKAKQAERDAKNLAQQVQQLPFIKGAKNKSALGQTIQYVMGSVYNTPYKLNDVYYSIGGDDGEKQYINLILSCGYGGQHISSLSIGSSILQEWGGTEAQSGTYAVRGDSPYYDAENVIEIAQSESLKESHFTQKVKSDYLGAEIKHEFGKDAEDLIHQCADYAQRVEVCIQFNGLRKYEDGNWGERSVTITPYWTNDNGANWQKFTFDKGSNTFTKNSNTTIRYTATKSFTYAESYGKQISIKLVRETPMMESNSNETAYLLYVNTFCYDNAKSKAAGALIPCAPLESPFMERTTRIGVRMIANDSTKDILDEFNVMTHAMARTWSKPLKTWREYKTPTRNPASWILDVLESDTHKPSKYDDAAIDMDSLGELYEYCEENEFYCDGIVTKEIKKSDLITKILSLCNADLFINSDGKLQVVIDKKEALPVALLNSQSVKSAKVAKSFERQPDGIKATFTNRDTWLMDTAYIMRDGGEKKIDDTCTETTIEFATTYEHVYKICQRRMRQQALQPRELTVSVGREGDYYPLYSTVMLQLEQLRQGIRSAVIHRVIRDTGGAITAFVLSDKERDGDIEYYTNSETDEVYTSADGEPYMHADEENYVGAIIQAQDDTGKRHIAVRGVAYGRYFFLDTPLKDDGGIMPKEFNIVSVGLLDANGEFERVTNVMKITAVKPDGDGGWELTLKDYSEAIYEYGDEIPEYHSNLTTPTKKELTPQAITETKKDVEQQNKDAEIIANIATEKEERTEADNTFLELSKTALQFHIDGETKTLYTEALEFSAAITRADVALEADAVSVSTNSNAFTATYTKNGAIITVTVTATYGAAYSTSAKVTVTATYGGNTYTADCALTASDTGVYLGAISAAASIPASPTFGDYFTWTGANTASTLVNSGTLYNSYLYKYVGKTNGAYTWVTDNRNEHNANALSDILTQLNGNLQTQNAYGTTFMDRLVANNIFTNNLLAKTAFVESLKAKIATFDIVFTGDIKIEKGLTIPSYSTIPTFTGKNLLFEKI